MDRYSKYNKTVILWFDPDKHRYSYTLGDGPAVDVVSVTGVTNLYPKPWLVPWAVKMTAEWWRENYSTVTDDEVALEAAVKASKSARWASADDALKIGDIVHKYAEAYAMGLEPDMPKNKAAKGCCEQFEQWWADNQVVPIKAEHKIFSLKHKYAGTLDLYAEVNGRKAIVDYKSSKVLSPDYFIQNSAYKEALQEEEGEEIPDRYVVRFDKLGGEMEAVEAREQGYDDKDDFTMFRAMLYMHQWVERKK